MMNQNLLLIGFGGPEVILISTALVFLLLVAFVLVCQWRIISKCGEAGWSCLIPFYNIYIMCKMVKKPELFKYWLLLIGVLFIGSMSLSMSTGIGVIFLVVVGIAILVILIMFYNALSTAFGQDAGFTVGLILLSLVFMAILAFGNYNYVLNNENSASGDMLDA
ncbi:MAG: DUF5684 domain-containing protein [Bacteroidota bacterium]|jgi:hypothetical protein